MNGFIIQDATCPCCGIRPTVRLGFTDMSLCMNCRGRWHSKATVTRPALHYVARVPPVDIFSPAEQARLEIYRRAVTAGFFNDWPRPDRQCR